MKEKRITTDPPNLAVEYFEDLLATDPLFVGFFNRFLLLPTFPEALRFNPDSQEFEVIGNDREELAEKIKQIHRSQQPISAVYKNAIINPPIRLPHYEREELERKSKEDVEIKTTFRIKCLDKEQGMEWMKRHRMPMFLRSELYNEYRLCRLLGQVEKDFDEGDRLKIDNTLEPWLHQMNKKPKKKQEEQKKRPSSSRNSQIKIKEKTETLMPSKRSKVESSFQPSVYDTCRPSSVQQARFEIADDDNQTYLQNIEGSQANTVQLQHEDSTIKTTTKNKENSNGILVSRSLNIVRVEPSAYTSDDEEENVDKDLIESSSVNKTQNDVEGFINGVIDESIQLAFHSILESEPEIKTEEPTKKPTFSIDSGVDEPVETSLTTIGGGMSTLSRKWMENQMEPDENDEIETSSVFSNEEEASPSAETSHNTTFKEIKGFDKFRNFVKGSSGEKMMHLWLDVDQSRFMLNKNNTVSYLQRLREVYLTNSSNMQLSVDYLKQHQLNNTSQWTLEHLQNKQRHFVEPLLLYWAPRFIMHQLKAASHAKENLERPLSRHNIEKPGCTLQTFPSPKTITMSPLRPHSCIPSITKSMQSEGGLTSSQKRRCGFVMENLLSIQHKPTFTQPKRVPSYLAPKIEDFVRQQNGPEANMRKGQTRNSAKRYRSVQGLPFMNSKSQPLPSQTSLSDERKWQIEEMLQALCHDTRAGMFFTDFCEKSHNKQWINSAHFWFDVQQYRHLFYEVTFDEYLVNRRSKAIFAKYILSGSPKDVGLSLAIRNAVTKRLNPAFEELFDDAEEYVLQVLLTPWKLMSKEDRKGYSRVEIVEQERSVTISSKYMSCIQKKNIAQRKPPSTPGMSHRSQEEDLWSRVPEEFRDMNFDELVKNRIELENFRDFMDANFSKIDLMCWLDAETFKRLPHQAEEKREQKAKEFKSKYLNKKYFFGHTSPATKQEQNEAVVEAGGWGKTLKERPPTELILAVQKYAKRRIENKWLPLFLASDAFQERQKSQTNMSDVAEDIVLQRKKKRGEPWRQLDSRWQSSSRDVIEFRRGLSNQVTVAQFRRYVSVKGDLLENDVLFWIEVQKYKDFCHIHNDPAAIESKISSIISCFLNSQIPPSLQIDIPSEMAEKIIEKRKELGPYIFREAQVTVFRVLFPHWNGFCEFRKTLGNDSRVSSALDRQKRKKTERLKQQAREQEEALRQEEARIKREESNAFDFGGDLFSLKTGASEAAESFFEYERIVPIAWTYGKHMEELERKRLMLLMENELEGRVPFVQTREIVSLAARTDTDSKLSGKLSVKKSSTPSMSLQLGQIRRKNSTGKISNSASVKNTNNIMNNKNIMLVNRNQATSAVRKSKNTLAVRALAPSSVQTASVVVD